MCVTFSPRVSESQLLGALYTCVRCWLQCFRITIKISGKIDSYFLTFSAYPLVVYRVSLRLWVTFCDHKEFYFQVLLRCILWLLTYFLRIWWVARFSGWFFFQINFYQNCFTFKKLNFRKSADISKLMAHEKTVQCYNTKLQYYNAKFNYYSISNMELLSDL